MCAKLPVSLLMLSLLLPAFAQGAGEWRLDPADGSWSQRQEDDACHLVHDMAPFGRMILTQTAPARFAGIIVATRSPAQPQLGDMLSVTPAWQGRGQEILRHVEASPGLNAIRFDDRTVRTLLGRLEEGDFVVLRFDQWDGRGVDLRISPVGLRAALHRHLSCLLAMPEGGPSAPARENPASDTRAPGPTAEDAQSESWISAPSRAPTVFHFGTDSASLAESDLERLRALAQSLQSRVAWNRIVVSGYTDPTGSRSRNKALALARAVEVRNRLIQYGIEPDRIEVSARPGTSGDAMETDPDERASARRAEIRASL